MDRLANGAADAAGNCCVLPLAAMGWLPLVVAVRLAPVLSRAQNDSYVSRPLCAKQILGCASHGTMRSWQVVRGECGMHNVCVA